MRARSVRLGVLLLVITVVLVGCSDSDPAPSGEPTASEPTASESATPSESVPPSPKRHRAYDPVRFDAIDGQRRHGRLYGEGPVAVVLSHMGRPGDGPRDWDGFARRLADRGYRALAYERRLPYETIWKDVLGAAEYLRTRGATTVIAAGASIGAMASLRAAEEPDAKLDGVIWLAGVLSDSGYEFRRADVARVGCPTLVVSGADDLYGAGPDARQLHRWLTARKELLILDSAEHGTDIFDEPGPNPRELTRTLLRFTERTARADGPRC